MEEKILKWGNSQGIIIPKTYLEECNLKVNETVNVEVRNKELVIRPAFRHKTLEERVAECGGNWEISRNLIMVHRRDVNYGKSRRCHPD